ncbi:MAG: D-alanyl-D-alanine carboxypeptidase [Desulfovibrio sp.]|jgi:D-alanyl-D-alanine carboxypeptidase (penicillin-binding protein 5/6)|nr:D-alanyl-D-alanine carboxypeptidase [Desulfovibrio sp.]
MTKNFRGMAMNIGDALMLAAFFIFFCFAASPAGATAPAVPQGAFLGVSSAILYDLDTEAVLFEQNADARIPPASLAKVLSMFLALDHIASGQADFDSAVVVSRGAASETGARMGLKTDDRVALQKLLLGMAVSSGNDASTAVAEFVGGSTQAFVRMMNVKARRLGMRDSNFCNPHGLPHQEQYTTARDMLTLARAYLRAHPFALRFHNTHALRYRDSVTWNKNPLLGQYEGADGLKTGWIKDSGYNLIFTASHGEKRLLAVIMGAPDVGARGNEACRLLDAGFLVSDNQAVSVASALYNAPLPQRNLDLKKNAHEAGVYQTRKSARQNGQAIRGKRRK